MILNNITNAYVGASEVKQICLGTYVIWQNGQPVVVYEVINTDITSYTGNAPKVYVLDVERWYIRTIGGNYTEYGMYATGKPQDPYIGELAIDNNH
jgi:hypothetical protein